MYGGKSYETRQCEVYKKQIAKLLTRVKELEIENYRLERTFIQIEAKLKNLVDFLGQVEATCKNYPTIQIKAKAIRWDLEPFLKD
jgi:predicted RNase H-like nuclease (RuvC/YqgF family)